MGRLYVTIETTQGFTITGELVQRPKGKAKTWWLVVDGEDTIIGSPYVANALIHDQPQLPLTEGDQ